MSVYLGGLVESVLLGQVFDRLGWLAGVIGVTIAIGISCILAIRLVLKPGQVDEAAPA